MAKGRKFWPLSRNKNPKSLTRWTDRTATASQNQQFLILSGKDQRKERFAQHVLEELHEMKTTSKEVFF